MKTTKILITILVVLFLTTIKMNAQVKIGGTAGDTPYDQAILELESAAKGLRLPQLTTAQRNALVTTNATKAKGLMIFNTETGCAEMYNGAWFALCDNMVKVTDCAKVKAFTIQGDVGTMVDGAIVTYKIDPTINPNVTYTWSVTGTNNTFIGSTSGNEVSVKWKSTGVLTAKAYGCTSSATATIATVQTCASTSAPTFLYQAKNPYKGGTYTYQLNPLAGEADYAWTVTNGTIVEGQGTNRIRVSFPAIGTATVKVTATLGDCTLSQVSAIVNPVIDDKVNYSTITPGAAITSTTNTGTYDYAKDQSTITDADGNTYTVKEYYRWVYNGVNAYVKADRQIWMTQNLATYISGGGILLNMMGGKVGGFAGQNNSYVPTTKVSSLPAAQRDTAKVFGFLYDATTMMDGAGGDYPKEAASTSRIRGICPSGWSIPSDRDWTDLEWLLSRPDRTPVYVSGGTGVTSTDYSLWTSLWETSELTGTRNPAGLNSPDPASKGFGIIMKKDKITLGAGGTAGTSNNWNSNGGGYAYANKNSTGFNAMLGGQGDSASSGNVRWGGQLSKYWSMSKYVNGNYITREFHCDYMGVSRNALLPYQLGSLRCVIKP